MQELFSDSDHEEPEQKNLVQELARAYTTYWRERNPGEHRRASPAMFDEVAKYCRKNSVNPWFFVHAIFNSFVGARITPFLFKDPKIALHYEAWLQRVPQELIGVDLVSPHTIDIHRELETMASMILTKYGKLEYASINFKIACADPVFDVTPVSRVILAEAHPIVLKYYGQDYLEWTGRGKQYEDVLLDFGLNHAHIEREINGR